MSLRLSSTIRPFVAALAVILLVLGLTSPAEAAATTTISGVVSFGTEGAHPVGLTARVTVDTTTSFNTTPAYATADTDASGAYTIAVPANVNVRLRFQPLQAGWQTQFYQDHYKQNSSTAVTVQNTPLTGINQTIPANGSISGHVYLGSTALSAGAGQVRVGWQVCYEDGCISSIPTTTLTDSAGNYSFPSLGNGVYTLTYTLVSGSAYQSPAPVIVTVNNAQTTWTGRDVTLPLSGGISGTVYLGSTETPAGAGEVTVRYETDGVTNYSFQASGSVTTDVNGTYSLPGLRSGGYVVQFDYNGDQYADEWWNDSYSHRTAASIPVTTSSAATANAVLAPGSSISGTVTNGENDVLSGIQVLATAHYRDAADDNAGFQYTTTTDSSGQYFLAGLPAGDYTVRFFSNVLGAEYDVSIQVDGVGVGQSVVADKQLLRTAIVDGWATCAGCSDDVLGPRQDMSGTVETRASTSDPWVAVPGGSFVGSNGYFQLRNLLPGEYRAAIWYSGIQGYAVKTTTAPFMLAEGENHNVGTVPIAKFATAIAAMYAYHGGASGALGAATSAIATVTTSGGGSIQHFTGGSIYASVYGGNRVVWADPIRAAYWNANSIYGVNAWPGGDRVCADDGSCSQIFTGGTTITASKLAVSQAPALTGSAIVGGSLTASAGTYTPSASGYTYAWLRDGTKITGATSATYTVVAADAGHVIRAEVTASRTYNYPAVTLTAPTAAIAPSAAMQIASLYASTGGSLGPLGASTSVIAAFPNNGGGSLQHYANGSIYSSVAGGTWVVYAGPIRETYWAANSISGSYGWPTGARDCTSGTCVQSFTGGTITPELLAVTLPPTVSGTPMVGGLLSAGAGSYAPAATSYTYAWLRDGVRISGAIAPTYIATAADFGHTLQAEVTATRSTRLPTVTLTAATGVVGPGAPTLAPVPTVSGSAKVGVVLTATPGAWASGTTFTYQWLAGGAPVTDATNQTFTPGPAEFGKTITVRVVGANPAYAPTTRTSAATAAVVATAFTTAPVPSIVGTPQVGVALTADPGTWSPTATFTYQWYANGVAISAAKSSTFVPAGAQLGARITVAVAGASLGYTTTTKTSSATLIVAAGLYAGTPEPTVVGAAAVGATLTADTTGWDSGSTFSYRWFSDDVPIAGATSATFVPTATQLGETITVRVTSTTAGYPVVVRHSSVGSGAIVRGSFSTAPTPTISGVAKKGSTLTAVPGTWAPTATFVFQWYADGAPIIGAESATFVPTATQVGAAITVRVIGTKTGWTSTARVSAATTAVAP